MADIAREKAGILKPGCAVVVGLLPPEAEAVVRSRIIELGCPSVWTQPALDLQTRNSQRSALYQDIEYPLPLQGEIQLNNSAIAIATLQILQQMGWDISKSAIACGMAKTSWAGRLQWVTWQNHQLLIDGAHNPAAAQALRQYVDTQGVKAITWVMGMLSTKDHADIFRALLRPFDELYLVPVPEHSSAAPDDLATLAQNICPELAACRTYPELALALNAAVADANNLIVLCGSLYLIGQLEAGRQRGRGAGERGSRGAGEQRSGGED